LYAMLATDTKRNDMRHMCMYWKNCGKTNSYGPDCAKYSYEFQ
jgi:hypothetical protein